MKKVIKNLLITILIFSLMNTINVFAEELQWIIEPSKSYSSNSYFSEGLCLASKDGLVGYTDKTGNWIIPPIYSYGKPFSDGLGRVTTTDKKVLYLDKTGNVVLEFADGYSRSIFSDGISLVGKGGNQYMFSPDNALMDKSGKYIADFNVYDDFNHCQEGMIVVKKYNKYGVIDKTGKVIVEPSFDNIYSFSEGFAAVNQNGKWGYIDKTGAFIIKPQFEWALAFKDGMAQVMQNGKYGYIDKTGKVCVECKYSYAGKNFNEGLAAVQENGKWGFIDKTGNYIISPQYQYANPFSEGVAAVQQDFKWSLIDKTGKVLIEFGSGKIVSKYVENEGIFLDGLLAVATPEGTGFIKNPLNIE